MGILEIFLLILIFIFPLGEIGRIQLANFAFSANDLGVLLLVSIWFLRILKKRRLTKPKLLKPILIFVLIGLTALLLNYHTLSPSSFFVSFLYLVRWILYSLVYFIVLDLKPSFKRKIPYILITFSSIVVFAGYIQFFLYPNLRNLYYLGWDEHLYRMFSTFLDPNFTGAFFVLSLMLCLGLIFNALKNKRKILVYALCLLAGLNFLAVYLTYSRSALLMLAVSLFTFFILLGKKKWVILLSLLLVLVIFIIPKSFKTEGTNILRVASNEARLESASNAIRIIKDNPILGVGFNAYRYAQLRYGFIKGGKVDITHSGSGTDNSFLFIFATTGIIGLLSYLYLLKQMFKLGMGDYKKNIYSVVFISSMFGIIVDSLFINSLFYIFIMEWVWILTGITEST